MVADAQRMQIIRAQSKEYLIPRKVKGPMSEKAGMSAGSRSPSMPQIRPRRPRRVPSFDASERLRQLVRRCSNSESESYPFFLAQRHRCSLPRNDGEGASLTGPAAASSSGLIPTWR
jgi:hypothetical protein